MKTASLLTVCALLVLGACATEPEIGQGLPGASPGASPGQSIDAGAAFDRRIKARFPVGSAEAGVVAELTHEGFKISPCADPKGKGCAFQHFAIWTRAASACKRDWQVLWEAADGRVTRIEGRYYANCS
jgi:hypothetical protein